MSEWTWEPDDFAALWYSDANDRFPRPLHFISRFRFSDEAAAHRDAVRNRYTRDELDEINLALHTLTTSDLRIEIRAGTVRHKNSDGHTLREHRVVGARNLYHAVVLSQTAIEGVDSPIRARLCRPEALAPRLVNVLPPCDPGSHKPDTFHIQDLRPRTDGYLEDAARNSPRERHQRLLGRRHEGGGDAYLRVGPLYSRPRPRFSLRWYDVADDGRYTELRARDRVDVRPTTHQDLSGQFNTWVERALQELRDDQDDVW